MEQIKNVIEFNKRTIWLQIDSKYFTVFIKLIID